MNIKKYIKLKNYINTIKYKLNFIKNKFTKKHKVSYSQCGEDIIIGHAFQYIGIKRPTYLDLGAHHPFIISNTALLYKNGSTGVCIEADPASFRAIKKYRKNDTCLNIGVGIDSKNRDADFYVMCSRVLSTFSKREAERIVRDEGQKIKSIVKIPIMSVNQIISENFKDKPNFVSIDIEGWDFEVLKSFDFEKYRPEVFCVETLTFTQYTKEQKLNNIIEFMKEKNYFVFADTYLNTIFVDKYSF